MNIPSRKNNGNKKPFKLNATFDIQKCLTKIKINATIGNTLNLTFFNVKHFPTKTSVNTVDVNETALQTLISEIRTNDLVMYVEKSMII